MLSVTQPKHDSQNMTVQHSSGLSQIEYDCPISCNMRLSYIVPILFRLSYIAQIGEGIKKRTYGWVRFRHVSFTTHRWYLLLAN